MEDYINKEQDRRLKVVEEHIAKTNEEIGSIKADISWLKWYVKLMVGGQIGIILTLVGILVKLLSE